MVLVESTPLMMLGTTKKRLNRRNNDKYKFWHGGRSSPITYIQTLPSSFNNGLLNLFGIRTAQTTPEERSNGDTIANSIFRYISTCMIRKKMTFSTKSDLKNLKNFSQYIVNYGHALMPRITTRRREYVPPSSGGDSWH